MLNNFDAREGIRALAIDKDSNPIQKYKWDMDLNSKDSIREHVGKVREQIRGVITEPIKENIFVVDDKMKMFDIDFSRVIMV